VEMMTLLDAGHLTEAAAAQFLRVTPQTLQRWVNLRVAPPRTFVGRTPYYALEDLKSWLTAQRERPAGQKQRHRRLIGK
jgi:hypothetical protein